MSVAYDGYEAIVFDLDGTIVRLAVDWGAVATDVERAYVEAGVEPESRDLWSMMEEASANGLGDVVEETIATYERAGARSSRRLPLADDLERLDRPTAICSLNCEDACRIALETHGLDGPVDYVVGRDTGDAHKPDPAPLLAAVTALDATPERTLFVGDSPKDELTANRAGTAFRFVDDGVR